MTASAPKGPFKLVTVNNAPARAKLLIGRVVENLKDRYTIDYVGNCESEEQIAPKVTALQPDILVCASMWELETSNRMRKAVESIIPGIKTHAIPFGMQIQQGPDAVVAYLTEQVPKLLE